MALGNIYENKNFRMFALIPIALLLISLYFIPKITLDSSLRGGISVQIQTNSSPSLQTLTSEVDSKIPGAQASVTTAPAGISITIATNASLSNAQQQLLTMYSTYGNYSTSAAKVALYQNLQKAGNTSVQGALSQWQANESSSLTLLGTEASQFFTTLKPLLKKQYSYNATNPQQTLNVSQTAFTDASTNYKNYVVSTLQGIIPFTSYTYQEVTPTLGAFFLGQMQDVIIASFIIVAISVFILFRTPIPALAVVFGAGNDIIVALGAMGLFGIPLGVASIGGLLMLIGYSIDTDMLAAIRIIKRHEGTPTERAFSTFKTGITMTTAAIISFAILLIISYVTFIPTYFEIASVVLFGLIADLFTTWLGNTPMVLWYKLRKEVR